MLITSLDESGKFTNSPRELNFIGGFIYRGEDEKAEARRLVKMLKQGCEKAGLSFPEDLHRKQRDEKMEILETRVQKYLKERGNYQLVVKLNNNLAHRSKNVGLANPRDDREAENLYENMLLETLKNIIFNNPEVEAETEFNLKIATRMMRVDQHNSHKIKEYDKLYPAHYNRENEFYITGKQTVKAYVNKLVEDYQLGEEITFTCDVKKNNYYPDQAPTPFLNLADIICDFIREEFKAGADNQYHSRINRVEKLAEKITGRPVLLWAYDDIDDLWQKAIDHFRAFELGRGLSCLYQLKNSNSNYADYYRRQWVSKLETDLAAAFKAEKAEEYVNHLEKVLIIDNNYQQAKLEKN